MSIKVSFADLTHTGQIVAANTFPLGVAMVASYALDKLGDEIDAEIFRYPDDFSTYLDKNQPRIACFSNFLWNLELSHEYARRLKELWPETITVFGGPNFPTDKAEQEAFLASWPAIDFYIDGEGELAFVELFEALKHHDFDVQATKDAAAPTSNVLYLHGGEMVTGNMLPRIMEMDDIPSVYVSGLCDKFFDDILIPMLQTSRGCPYSCTFCHEGQLYFNKTRRFSQERIEEDIAYIAERARVPDFQLVDSNFGMFAEDIQTARLLSRFQDKVGWPRYLSVATAKNHKKRVIEAASLLRGALPPGASIQTTDEGILSTIKRKNLPIDAIAEVAATAETASANSFSEIILCLPGDSKKAHFKSVFDMVEAGINYVRMYQFMMLHGTESASIASRERFGMETVYRVLPRCFGMYTFRGTTFPVAEVEEICTANNTMPHDDYLDCRALDLSIEIFNNGGFFADITRFVVSRGVTRTEFLTSLHERAISGDDIIAGLYKSFREEEDANLWDSHDDLHAFVHRKDVIARYVEGELGQNELYKYRASAVFRHARKLHDLVYDLARELLDARGQMDAEAANYIDQLKRLSLLRKCDLLDEIDEVREEFTFDFTMLNGANYTMEPGDASRPNGLKIMVYHSDDQRLLIDDYKKQYGTTLVGLGRILLRAHMGALYRQIDYPPDMVATAEAG